MDDHGEVTDADRKRAAERLGAARGRGLRRLDVLRRPAGPARARGTCASAPGTACFAATGEAHVARGREGARARRSASARADGSLSLGRDRLPGLLPLLPGGARRRDDRRRARRAVAACRRTTPRAAAEPGWRSLLLDEPVLTAPGDWSGLRRALAELGPEELLDRGQGRPRSAGAAAPASRPARSGSSRAQAAGAEKFIVANGDEGDPGSYIDKYLMEQNPSLLLEGLALAGFAVGAGHGFVLTPLGVPALEAGARPRGRQARAPTGCSARTSSARASTSTSRSSRAPAPTSSARRRRCSPACRGCAARSRRARRSRPSAASTGCRRSSTTSRRCATWASSPRTAPTPTARSAPTRDDRARSSSASTSASSARASTRCRFGMTMRELCEDVAGGLARRARDQGDPDRRPARRDPARLQARHRRSTSTRWPPRAAWSATAASSPSTTRPTCAPSPTPPAALRRARELRQVLPVPDRAASARTTSSPPTRRSTSAVSKQLLEALELG